MNNIDFNNKYSEFLEQGFEGLEFDISEVTNLLDKLFENQFTKIEGFTYSQIKIKYSSCRFYSDILPYETTREVEETINEILRRYLK